MNIKTILAITTLAALGVAHAKDEPTKENKANTSAAATKAVSAEKKPTAAPEPDKAANGGPRLRKGTRF